MPYTRKRINPLNDWILMSSSSVLSMKAGQWEHYGILPLTSNLQLFSGTQEKIACVSYDTSGAVHIS